MFACKKPFLITCFVLLPWLASAQSDTDQGSLWKRWHRSYETREAPEVSFENSARIEGLIGKGKLTLTLEDAIELALENNLDVELQRFNRTIAASELMRTSGGGTLRGFSFSVSEIPAGVGGPSGPILNLPATGAPSLSAVSTSIPEISSIVSSSSNAVITGSVPLSNGTAIPNFEPTLFGTLNFQHMNTAQTNLAVSGSDMLTGRTSSGNIGFQKAFSTGALFSTGYIVNSVKNNAMNTFYNPFTISSFSVNLSQPLLRGFGSEVNRRFVRIARNNQSVSDLVFKQQVIATVAGIIRLYFDLVALQEDVQVKRQTLELVQKLYNDSKAKVDQGVLAPIELVRAQAQMASSRQDLANSEGFELQQELVLKNVLTRRGTADTLIRDARIVPTTPIAIPTREDIQPIQDMVETAYRNRPELREGQLQVENSEITLKGAKSALRPQLDLTLSAQNTSLAGYANPLWPGAVFSDTSGQGGTGTSFLNLFQSAKPSYGFGLQLSLPLHNSVAEADYARDAIQLRQTQIRYQQLQNQIRAEVESALIAVNRSRGAYDAAVEARNLQEQSLKIETEKYENGVSTNLLVMQYQSYLAQARSTEVAAKSVYAKAKTALERALGLTLESHSISLDETRQGRSGVATK
jgi:outer membrane protein